MTVKINEFLKFHSLHDLTLLYSHTHSQVVKYNIRQLKRTCLTHSFIYIQNKLKENKKNCVLKTKDFSERKKWISFNSLDSSVLFETKEKVEIKLDIFLLHCGSVFVTVLCLKSHRCKLSKGSWSFSSLLHLNQNEVF